MAKSAGEISFRIFFIFGIATVLLAVGGSLFSFFGNGGFRFNGFGLLLFLMGLSLALMLGSLLFIRKKRAL